MDLPSLYQVAVRQSDPNLCCSDVLMSLRNRLHSYTDTMKYFKPRHSLLGYRCCRTQDRDELTRRPLTQPNNKYALPLSAAQSHSLNQGRTLWTYDEPKLQGRGVKQKEKPRSCTKMSFPALLHICFPIQSETHSLHGFSHYSAMDQYDPKLRQPNQVRV